jgi:hypothetical protein
MKRTAAIYMLTIIAVIAGLVAVFDTLRFMGWLFSPLDFLVSPVLGGMLSGILAAIWFWAATRIWNLDEQGWMFIVGIAAFYLVFDVVALLAGTAIELLLPSIVISILALILGLLPGTRSEFGNA